jgi:hypothetical protein
MGVMLGFWTACGGKASNHGAVSAEGSAGNAGNGGRGNAGAAAGWSTCFEAGTRIATPEGDVPIERLKVGDVVLALDEQTLRVVPEHVTATMQHQDRVTGSLRLDSGVELRVTPEHPVYLPEERRYVRADEVETTSAVLYLSGDSAAPMLSTATGSGFESFGPRASTTVYNLSVSGHHNYFAERVLVHNKSGGSAPIAGTGGTAPCTPTVWPIPDDVRCIEQMCLGYGGDAPEGTGGFGGQPEGPMGGAGDLGASGGGGGGESSSVGGEGGASEVTTVLARFPWCESVSLGASYVIAFDDWSNGSLSGFGFYSADENCTGTYLGELTIYREPTQELTESGTWETHCLRIPTTAEQGLAVTLNGRTKIENVRMVDSCDCIHGLRTPNDCTGDEGPAFSQCE